MHPFWPGQVPLFWFCLSRRHYVTLTGTGAGFSR